MEEAFVHRISTQIENQFPDVFKEEGENLVAFLKAYYEWLEENQLLKSFKLQDYNDIDNTLDEFLDEFQAKYMAEIPESIIGDKRLLQKHILDIYRSKGSNESIRLLFRLLFNEEIDIYIPSVDIIKASDGQWIERKYIEISSNQNNESFQGVEVFGAISKASAIVEWYEERFYEGKKLNLLFVENIKGQFIDNEPIYHTGIELIDAPIILGSIQSGVVTFSQPNFEIGETLRDANTAKSGSVWKVSSLQDVNLGIIEPNIIDGGTGYTLDADISLTGISNTSGSGAEFEVGSLSNTSNVDVIVDLIQPYASTNLNSSDYGFPSVADSNINTPLAAALNSETFTIGTINSISTINPGVDYDGRVRLNVVDPVISVSGMYESSNSSVMGDNSDIIGEARHGNNSVVEIRLIDSGFLYYKDGESITLQSDLDSNKIITVKVVTGGVGIQEGFYRSNKGFLDSNKKIIDSYYYQEHSYVIKSSKALEKYSKLVRDNIHPAGNELFGEINISNIDKINFGNSTSSVTQEDV